MVAIITGLPQRQFWGSRAFRESTSPARAAVLSRSPDADHVATALERLSELFKAANLLNNADPGIKNRIEAHWLCPSVCSDSHNAQVGRSSRHSKDMLSLPGHVAFCESQLLQGCDHVGWFGSHCQCHEDIAAMVFLMVYM